MEDEYSYFFRLNIDDKKGGFRHSYLEVSDTTHLNYVHMMEREMMQYD